MILGLIFCIKIKWVYDWNKKKKSVNKQMSKINNPKRIQASNNPFQAYITSQVNVSWFRNV